MSGLTVRSCASPHDEKPDTRPAVESGVDTVCEVQVKVVGPDAMRPSIRTPLAAVIVTTGMVMGGFEPGAKLG
jgi:hypothetical protein